MPDRMMNRWKVPDPYGAARAMDGMGSVAAPLLAAGALGLLGLVLSVEEHLRSPSLALLLLVISSSSLVLAVQSTFWMRQYNVTPSEMRQWHDDADHRLSELRDTQWTYQVEQQAWENRARRSYQVGIVALYAGVAVVLIPRGNIDVIRAIAIGVAGLAALAEVVWSSVAWLLTSRYTDRIHGTKALKWVGQKVRLAPEWCTAPRELRNPLGAVGDTRVTPER